MDHSVIFDGKHTWNDWHLIPASRPTIAQPKLKTEYVDLPGVGSSVDFSEFLSGRPIYGNRTGNMEFVVLHDYWSSWEETRTTIANHLSGRYMKVILEDDPDHCYYGRCSLDEYRSEPDYSRIVIDYTFQPFKHLIEIPNRLRGIKVTGTYSVSITGTQAYESPTFIVSGSTEGLYVVLNDEWVYLPNGSTTDPRIFLGPGENKLTFRGTGTVTVDYREGVL